VSEALRTLNHAASARISTDCLTNDCLTPDCLTGDVQVMLACVSPSSAHVSDRSNTPRWPGTSTDCLTTDCLTFDCLTTDCLTGNVQVMLACVSPSSAHVSEALRTLNYATSAKNIN